MFPRVLFLLLLALNIGGACWIAFAPQAVEDVRPASDPGVAELVLLSERDGLHTAASKSAQSNESGTRSNTGDVCHSIGPFQTQSDMRATLNSLTPLVRRIQYRDERATQSRGYWVFLAALNSREEALGVARRLSAQGVRDYYVVTAGEQLNTISLGLFREKSNAERRLADIAAMGFEPQLIQRTEELPVYWIDYASDSASTFDWRSHVANANGLEQRTVDCF
ncbi:MAG TPA: SPOR domain-containing protein [Dokdonella sp.]|uniref:SPOR domain-containing protein n=1 Tax=Dokdonella sp. TaxID=2291710 RepID=UPI002D80F5C5|nr:SPOR domain-containing protein [Dokdonella sp.]HET9031628.1 SPOR domain-containing protein [Dokdonella sp.]